MAGTVKPGVCPYQCSSSWKGKHPFRAIAYVKMGHFIDKYAAFSQQSPRQQLQPLTDLPTVSCSTGASLDLPARRRVTHAVVVHTLCLSPRLPHRLEGKGSNWGFSQLRVWCLPAWSKGSRMSECSQSSKWGILATVD